MCDIKVLSFQWKERVQMKEGPEQREKEEEWYYPTINSLNTDRYHCDRE